jgi:DNA-binding transcriptional regulator YhcF (GntR family)
MRTYDHLQDAQIIYNKRGVGYFVNSGAQERIISIQRGQFIEEELPKIKRRLELLGLKANDIF